MNYATIKYYDIANGPGVRTSIFVSGCRHHCPGCFNEVAWDFGYGQPFDKAVRNEIFASCQPDYIAGISLLGGEPFEPENQRELLPFVRNFRALYPNKSVWCYSGYTWEQLTGSVPCPARCEVTDELLSLLGDFEADPERLWESNIFGKSLHELVNEGLQNKLLHMPQEARTRLQETLEQVINDGCTGLICILL